MSDFLEKSASIFDNFEVEHYSEIDKTLREATKKTIEEYKKKCPKNA